MTTIEVPISLIKAGDMDAIRELLPKPEPLFGRWATHPEHGRGIIISDYSGPDDDVWLAREEAGTGRTWIKVLLKDLTLDPVELTTAEDFENAPLGTVVSSPDGGDVFLKVADSSWVATGCTVKFELVNRVEANRGPYKILRWGWG